MVDDFKKAQCNGCKMCKDICPMKAISFIVDNEGFWYPQIDHDKCIECDLCSNTCAHNHPCVEYKNEPKVYAAWSNDTRIRMGCTSGGIAYELGRKFIEENGYVVGCRYRNNYKGAEHVIAHSLSELEPLMQSKYLQSDTEDIYIRVKTLLKKGEKVLFVGTPCQNAALSNYLGKQYSNLIQVEFICRGITSPLAHERYIDFLEKKYKSRITYFRSKDKRESWNSFGTSATFENGETYFKNRGGDPKTVSYHIDLTVRESCEYCICKNKNRVADITLADFWGIEEDYRNPYLEQGTSAVLISSEKGNMLFEGLGQRISYYEKTFEDVYNHNPALLHNIRMSPNRVDFWREFNQIPFDELVQKYKGSNISMYKKIVFKIRERMKK